jgi:hypothetical protein
MRAHDMKAVMIRLTSTEHALLQTILKEEAFTLQSFFRRAAMRKIQQRAQAVGALEAEAVEDLAQSNAPPGLDSR